PAGGRLAGALLLAAVAALGAARHQVVTRAFPPHHIAGGRLYGREVVLRGTAADEPEQRGPDQRFALDLESAGTDSGWVPACGRVLVTLRSVGAPVEYGQAVALRARLRQPPAARNPGDLDYRAYLAAGGVHGTAAVYRADQILSLEPRPAPWWHGRVVIPVRQALRRSIQRHLDGAPAGLLEAMILGEKHRIPGEVAASFRTAGLAHALVISGLHVGLVAAFFFTAFRLVRLPDPAACVATVAVLVLYAFVTELQAPVVRAAIMAGIALGGRLLQRPADVYNSLGAAAALILWLWPASLAGLGFQLSFGATLAIVGLHGPLLSLWPAGWRREDRWCGRWVISPLCACAAAQLGTGPLLAHHFQQFSPVSPVANLMAVPLLGLVVALAILGGLAGALLPWAGLPFHACNYLVVQLLVRLVEGLARVPGASIAVPSPGPASLAAGALGAYLLARAPACRWARKGLLFLALLALNAGVWGMVLRRGQLEVVFLDVGQGDAAFLRFPNGRTMLIDGGNRSFEHDYGARVVVPFLRRQGVRRLDAVVATHPHNDHIGGLVAVLEEIPVGHLLDSGQALDTWTARRLRELVETRGIAYHRVAAGDSLSGLGGVGALVLHPTAPFVTAAGESPRGLNNGSVVVRFTLGEESLLFAGDAEGEADPALTAWGERLRSRVLKVAHHGSSTSSEPAFLAAVEPQVAVVSVAAQNQFGHPSQAVMARYRDRGARLLRTDEVGAVTLRTRGRGLDLEVMVAAAR
ncbi:MAG: DNA internalization-related competence protein ComEC/Rec2, partial [Gemmatimonadota bacterium]